MAATHPQVCALRKHALWAFSSGGTQSSARTSPEQPECTLTTLVISVVLPKSNRLRELRLHQHKRVNIMRWLHADGAICYSPPAAPSGQLQVPAALKTVGALVR